MTTLTITFPDNTTETITTARNVQAVVAGHDSGGWRVARLCKSMQVALKAADSMRRSAETELARAGHTWELSTFRAVEV